MTLFTDRELEFLVSLSRSWRRRYCRELVRLLLQNGGPAAARREPPHQDQRGKIVRPHLHIVRQ